MINNSTTLTLILLFLFMRLQRFSLSHQTYNIDKTLLTQLDNTFTGCCHSHLSGPNYCIIFRNK